MNYNITRKACYFSYIAMASIFAMPPLLFVTFRDLYNISYTLLGTLVLINFCTQLCIDLIFTFFSKWFDIKKAIRVMPLITTAGLTIYALVPTLFPEYAYAGLVVGTLIFSVSAGLSEVLLSPTIAALPSEHPDKDMSILHSLYAWGVLFVVLITTLFLNIFGSENWMYLTLFFAALPIMACILFCLSPMPEKILSQNSTVSRSHHTGISMALFVGCIFLGSAAENVMTNWISGFMENSLFIPKSYGDILGMAAFALLLGLFRTIYAKYGHNIFRVLFGGMLGAAVCYLIIAFCNNSAVSLIACIMIGMFTSMLWPGTLIFMEEKISNPGIAAYALMAAGGDFGASVAPQLMGFIVDKVSASSFSQNLSQISSLTVEQIGMRSGMFVSAIFPIAGVFLLLAARRYFKKH